MTLFAKSYNCLHFFFLQSLVCVLMTANLWLKAQAQFIPLPLLNVPALNQAGVVPVIPGVAVGATGANALTTNFAVSIH
jgi:hypothetical protein